MRRNCSTPSLRPTLLGSSSSSPTKYQSPGCRSGMRGSPITNRPPSAVLVLLSPDSEKHVARAPSRQLRDVPLVMDVGIQALTMSRRHKLEFLEVKWMLQSLKQTESDLTNGGMSEERFRKFLLRWFDLMHVEDNLLTGAYEGAKAANGPVDIDKLLMWYKVHMFSLVAPLTADGAQWQSDSMVKELAKKFDVSILDIDKIKKAFDRFDTDKSGELEYEEFQNMLKIILGVNSTAEIPKHRVHRFWTEIDSNGNGVVDFEEFTAWYAKYFSTHDPDAGVLSNFYASFMPDVQRSQSPSLAILLLLLFLLLLLLLLLFLLLLLLL
ncbi:unnamed protein product [Polarella glacialis]|uniref:EF-hand domain-containing protein n=1 Tax=Polarella glacialis TaxID=89957 RepID=A0A813DQT8_POLGL|nr:unnamed protein product [Polarella glacialis]